MPGRRHGAYQVQPGAGAYDGGMTSNVQRSGGAALGTWTADSLAAAGESLRVLQFHCPTPLYTHSESVLCILYSVTTQVLLLTDMVK